MKLKAFLDATDETIPDFAKRIGVDRGAVSKYVHGRRVPRAHVMKRIHAVTDGLVTPNDFYDLPKAVSESGVAADAAA